MKQLGRANQTEKERAGFMTNRKPISFPARRVFAPWFLGLLFLFAASIFVASMLPAQSPAAAGDQQSMFASAEDAKQALVTAAKAKDNAALAGIFGPRFDELLSGDPVQDNHELDQFAAALDQSAKLEPAGNDKVTLTIGEHNWPFPIPIVKQADKWRFDTAAGMEEILNRRIGENELSAIATSRAYVLAQWEYFTEGDHDNDGVAEYAQHLYSAPGEKDGLYWDTAEGDKISPLGALVAAARAEGYPLGKVTRTRGAKPATPADPPATRHRTAYHGYYFKILKSQGAHAPGGKYNYIINENMIAGYALIAYPDKYGSSGVMTFIVNQQGRVYEKNLGKDTVKLASAITEYEPDSSWKLVKD